ATEDTKNTEPKDLLCGLRVLCGRSQRTVLERLRAAMKAATQPESSRRSIGVWDQDTARAKPLSRRETEAQKSERVRRRMTAVFPSALAWVQAGRMRAMTSRALFPAQSMMVSA